MKAQVIEGEFARGSSMQHLVLRYTQALTTLMAQTHISNCHYSMDQPLCRWLRLRIDQLQWTELAMAQELIAKC